MDAHEELSPIGDVLVDHVQAPGLLGPLAVLPHVHSQRHALAAHERSRRSSVTQVAGDDYGWGGHVAHMAEAEAQQLARMGL
ncbi:hypothetical protein ON010_g1234 [Phytophthora cinnamomi]|nr:hypothetical protein ON010_g1234 [Phytophthora cinnamomi]